MIYLYSTYNSESYLQNFILWAALQILYNITLHVAENQLLSVPIQGYAKDTMSGLAPILLLQASRKYIDDPFSLLKNDWYEFQFAAKLYVSRQNSTANHLKCNSSRAILCNCYSESYLVDV